MEWQSSGEQFRATSGAVAIDNDAELGVISNTVTLAGGSLVATGSFSSARMFALGDANGNGNGRVEVAAGNTFTIASPIGGAAGLIKAGSGTLMFAASNTYTGPTEVAGGVLMLGSAASIQNPSVVTVDAGAILHVGDVPKAIGTLFGAGTVIIGNGTLSVGSLSAATQFSGAISGSGAF